MSSASDWRTLLTGIATSSPDFLKEHIDVGSEFRTPRFQESLAKVMSEAAEKALNDPKTKAAFSGNPDFGSW